MAWDGGQFLGSWGHHKRRSTVGALFLYAKTSFRFPLPHLFFIHTTTSTFQTCFLRVKKLDDALLRDTAGKEDTTHTHWICD